MKEQDGKTTKGLRGSAQRVRSLRGAVHLGLINRGSIRTHNKSPDSRSTVEWQSRLAGIAIATAILFVLMGAVAKWHNGGGRTSAFVDILWSLVWVAYSLAKIVLVCVVIVTLYHYFSQRKTSDRS